MYLGIDLGTTNTVVARSFEDSDNKLVTEVVQIGQYYNDNWEKFPDLPSVVYFDVDGVIGAKPGDMYIGREAKRQREQDKNNVISNSKRFMGTQQTWNIDGRTYEARDVAAMVLQYCKKTIDREGNMNYDTVVITVPASFNSSQVQDTIAAAIQAGFTEEQIIIKHEPTAALVSFIDGEAKKRPEERYIGFSEKKRILVFDLGGGTCDTSVIDVQLSEKEMHFTEVGIGRYQELGGIDFDAALALELLNSFFKENNILEGDMPKEEQDALYDRLVLAAETLKEKLSATVKNKLSMEENPDIENITAKLNLPNFYNGKPYRISLTKSEYDKYTSSLYKDDKIHYKKFEDMDKNKNIIGVIRKTLEDWNIPKESIDYVFITGGMSQFITVKERIEAYLGKPIIAPENSMDAVARGASIYQHYRIREDKNELKPNIESLNDVSSAGIVDTMMLAEAVLLDMNEGLPKVIIPKKTIVPYEGKLIGEFKTSSPAGIMLNIYAAENEFDSSMRLQKCIEKRFNFPVESGTPFDISYRINENKAIEMTIEVNDAHKQSLDISIHSDFKITDKNYNIVMEEEE